MIGNKRLVDCKKDKEIKIDFYVFFNIVIFVYWYLCDI